MFSPARDERPQICAVVWMTVPFDLGYVAPSMGQLGQSLFSQGELLTALIVGKSEKI